MPDPNKFCGLCQHGHFGHTSMWGTCRKHRYEHLKHDNPDGGRGASIHSAGTCPNWQEDLEKINALGAHIVFLRREAG